MSLRKILKKNILLIISTVVLILILAILELVLPKVSAQIIDVAVANNDKHQLYFLSGLILLCSISIFVFSVFKVLITTKMAANILNSFITDVFSKIQNDFSKEDVDSIGAVSLISRVSSDPKEIATCIDYIINFGIRTPILLIVSLFFIFSSNIQLGLIVLITIPTILIIVPFVARMSQKYQRKKKTAKDEMNSLIISNINGVKEVRTYAESDYEIEKFYELSRKFASYSNKTKVISFLNMPIISAIVYIALIAVIFVGGNLVMQNVMAKGELFAILAYVTKAFMSLGFIAKLFTYLIPANTSYNRIKEVFEKTPSIVSKKDLGVLSNENINNLEFRNVSYGILKNISFELNKGESLGIIGQTGSGKSQLIQLIPRIYDIKEGNILINGINIKDINLKKLNSLISVVPQKSTLFSMSIMENLKMSNDLISDVDIMNALRISNCEFVNDLPLGINHFSAESGSNFSGGQKQRLTIARAILKKSPILILDDSTSALDAKTEKEIQNSIFEHLDHNILIITSQKISSVKRCNKILVLDNGKIESIGTHEELINNSKIYKEIYELQNMKLEAEYE